MLKNHSETQLKSTIHKLECDEGSLVYEDFGGTGEVVICLPSLGDSRHEYRFLTTKLQEKNFRVINMDLRGHGESDITFKSYNALDIANDISLLIKKLNLTKVNLIGCSISGGAIVGVGALNPDKVNKLIMISPFSRDIEGGNLLIMLGKFLFLRPWGVYVWGLYYNKLYPSKKPHDFDTYLKNLKANLTEKGRIEAVVKMFSAKKGSISTLLNKVYQDSLIIMGSKDIDFPNPLKEAEILSQSLGKKATIRVLEGLGHYPHAEDPNITSEIIIDFLER